MKNYLLILAVLCSTIAFAQDNELEEDGPVNLKSINDKKHEFRIDALEGLLVPALDISYEYVLSKYSGFGASINIAFDNDDDIDFRQKFAITPYYRQYFFNKKDFGARGFFAEGLLQYASGDTNSFSVVNNSDVIITEETWNRFGVGFAIGQKWVSRNGFVIELSLGGGRYFGNDEENFDIPEGFFRGGVSVGYRF